jgi:hypothetical protein
LRRPGRPNCVAHLFSWLATKLAERPFKALVKVRTAAGENQLAQDGGQLGYRLSG